MAPRGRSRKRDTRMAAAIEAMEPMGFQENLVRVTVKELLKTYEGEWRFIEDASYTVLVDTMLSQQQADAETRDAPPKDDVPPQDDNLPQDDAPPQDDASPRDDARYENDIETSVSSSSVILQACSKLEALDNILQTNDAKDCLPSTGERIGSQDTPVTHSTQPVVSLPPWRHRPSYGWICNDDEEDIVELPVGPMPQEYIDFFLRIDGKKKRKTRWDVRPENM